MLASRRVVRKDTRRIGAPEVVLFACPNRRHKLAKNDVRIGGLRQHPVANDGGTGGNQGQHAGITIMHVGGADSGQKGIVAEWREESGDVLRIAHAHPERQERVGFLLVKSDGQDVAPCPCEPSDRVRIWSQLFPPPGPTTRTSSADSLPVSKTRGEKPDCSRCRFSEASPA